MLWQSPFECEQKQSSCSWVWPWLRWFCSIADTLTAEIWDFTSFLLLSAYATHWHYWFNTLALIADISSVILLGSFIFIINTDEVIQSLEIKQLYLSTSLLICFSNLFLYVDITVHFLIISKFKYSEGRGLLHISELNITHFLLDSFLL